MSKRVFSQDEVQRLIRRAAELESGRSVSGMKNGLTLDELKSVAAESGLDPALLEKAAAELENTSSAEAPEIRVNREEIASEIWLDHRVDKATIDALITELNHIYGTSDELSWWDQLSGSHQGKAKVKRTSGSVEWDYKTDAGVYSTRVLMQQRGGRFRIRVSKRQAMNLSWQNSSGQNAALSIFFAFVFVIFAGAASDAVWDTTWPGILAGLLLAGISYPVMQRYSSRVIEKSKAEVRDTVQQLQRLIEETPEEPKWYNAPEFEPPPAQESSETGGKLRNHLRT